MRAWNDSLAEARRGVGGRTAFEAAKASWGAATGLVADDGLYLAEYGGAGCTLHDAVAALRDLGPSAKDVKAVTERLIGAGILEFVPSTDGR